MAGKPGYLTPGERESLALVRDRHQYGDGADLHPMLSVWYEEDGTRQERIIPWLVALNLDPSLGY